MKYLKKIIFITISVICFVVFCSCSHYLYKNERLKEDVDIGADNMENKMTTAESNSYSVDNDGFTTMEDGRYFEPAEIRIAPELSEMEGKSLAEKRYYIDKDVEKSDGNRVSNISVEIVPHEYTQDESLLLRDSITASINSQIEKMDEKAEVSISGTDTEKGYDLFVYIITLPDMEARMYYILGDKKVCLVNASAYTDNNPEIIFDSALDIVNSLTWS